MLKPYKLALGLLLGVATPAFADTITVTIDENCNSVVTGASVATLACATGVPDPGPGGLSSTLQYTLPFATTVGDVLFSDAGAILDVVRFNGSTIVFYSDNVDGFNSLADTPAPPGGLYANVVTIQEIGPEGDNGAFYTPTAGQPGFVCGSTVTYHFISDSVVPEPGTLGLLGTGLIGLIGAIRRKLIA